MSVNVTVEACCFVYLHRENTIRLYIPLSLSLRGTTRKIVFGSLQRHDLLCNVVLIGYHCLTLIKKAKMVNLSCGSCRLCVLTSMNNAALASENGMEYSANQ